MKKLLFAFVLIFALTSCTVDPAALLNDIVVAAELAVPVIAAISPDLGPLAQQADNYLNGIMPVVIDLTNGPLTPALIAKADADFQSKSIPSVDCNAFGKNSAKCAQIESSIEAVAQAVASFISMTQAQIAANGGTTVSPVAAIKLGALAKAPQTNKKLIAIRNRAIVVQSQIKK